MIQKTYVATSEADLLLVLDWLKNDTAYLNAKCKFVQVFLSRFDAVEAETIVYVLKKNVPELKIAGMSLYGDPFVGLNTGKSVTFSFCFFDESDVQVFDYDADKLTQEEIVRDFQKKLGTTKNPRGVLLLASGLTFKASYFMDNVTRGYDDIPFFGAISNINTADVSTVQPYAFGERFMMNGLVAVIFSGENLHFYSESLFSWTPIGKEMEVTACTKGDGTIGDTLIKTIDGIPATQIYKRYLNVEPNMQFIANVCEFPLVIKRKGCLMARIPCGYNNKGELNTMGDIRDGEKIRFTYGKTEEILKKSEEAAARMQEFMPQGIFLYVCANRAIFLKDRAKEEIDYYKSINPVLVYCHGFSELYRYEGKGGVFNSQLVTVALREGEPSISHAEDSLLLTGISFDDTEKKPALALKNGDTVVDSPNVNLQTLTQNTQNLFMEGVFTPIPLSERLATFLDATTEELKKMTQAANAASEAKSAFLSSMSHEIRSPINAVLGLDEMILRESNEEQIKGWAHDIQSSGKSLLSIINDILDFSKIEAGKMEIINDDYDLRQTITDLANMVENRAESKGLEFIVNVDTNMPHLLHGDETRIKQCALNILTNAVKYTPRGSVTLTIGFKKKDESQIDLEISVADTGIGIKEEDLEKLYKPFERIEEGRNRSIEGTGLGMSIVNGLLAQMNAHLSVKSVYGKGSDFSFTLEQTVRDWEKIGTREEAKAALLQNSSSYTESFQAPEAKILVVDDTPINLTVVKGLLKYTRIQVDTAESGAEALEMCRKTEYNIMFIDHLMPKMDGIEFLAANFSDSTSINKNTPAVALTANAVSGAKEMYVNAGFDDYLSKPIDSKKLEEMIARLLPKKLLILPGDKDFVESKKSEWNGEESRENVCEVSEIFGEVFGLDIEAALKNCGGKDVFKDAAENFYDSIEEKSNLIEEYAKSADWKNFTILVHALKSSARLIGATALSELAKHLEECGNEAQKSVGTDSQQENAFMAQGEAGKTKKDSSASAEIVSKTPGLLDLYRSYKQKLAPLLKKQPASGKKSKKPLISTEKLLDAFSALKEVVSAFDFDTADSIIEELSGYEIPVEYAEKYEKVKKAVRDADTAETIKIISN